MVTAGEGELNNHFSSPFFLYLKKKFLYVYDQLYNMKCIKKNKKLCYEMLIIYVPWLIFYLISPYISFACDVFSVNWNHICERDESTDECEQLNYLLLSSQSS